jgi:hypothetical protein
MLWQATSNVTAKAAKPSYAMPLPVQVPMQGPAHTSATELYAAPALQAVAQAPLRDYASLQAEREQRISAAVRAQADREFSLAQQQQMRPPQSLQAPQPMWQVAGPLPPPAALMQQHSMQVQQLTTHDDPFAALVAQQMAMDQQANAHLNRWPR